ncbi:MAG TPA: zinc dependent phospholipase C family protein [Bryobacteraceae bacterium]|nr:zinc dependent phospholipase C family protein [Bryobacteraceae bacterium]
MPLRPILVLVLGVWVAPATSGYSVLTHEAIIDTAWKDDIRPLLLKRFPAATPEELRKAHAYAYGGAIIQDMGYYPFGNRFFSDLAHYVRSGDLLMAMIAEAGDLNEYAFALGSLAHYAADNAGHPMATNRAVAVMYPKLARKFGSLVTYGDDPPSHLKVEFSFDVEQVAEGHYAPDAYHDFIGFEVAKPLLERAFTRTYSLEMSQLFFSEDLALGTYRHTVSSLIPALTKAAWHSKKKELQNHDPSITSKRFIYNISRASYRKRWGNLYEKPGLGARIIAFLFRLVPKVGPFRALAFRAPPPAVETMFMRSFDETLSHYRRLLAELSAGTLRLANDNFDTGQPLEPGTYALADNAYAKLVDKIHGRGISEELRANILAFYASLDAPFATKRDPKAWENLLHHLDSLKAAPAMEQAPSPSASSPSK